MKNAKLQNKSDKDLSKDLLTKKDDLRKFRFSVSGSKIKNIKEGRGLRKDIARLLTEMSLRKKNNTESE